MRIKNLILLPLLSCAVFGAARANWQYAGNYLGDGAYADDGSRFVLSFRGGASASMGTIKNDMGSLSTAYYVGPDGGVIPELYYQACVEDGGCADFTYAGVGELSHLPPTEDYSGFAFAGGASIGWTIPGRPQWRIEAGWDHITESEYNASPMLEGELTLDSGAVVYVPSGSVSSKVSTDIISLMAFYDFYDGLYKPVRDLIPYVGFGFGYSDSKTVLNLVDPYGDLSADVDLQNFGKPNEWGVLQFYQSERHSANVAIMGAAGASYGITETMFLDFGARVAYIPKVTWALRNEDDTRHRNWFAAEDMIYLNFMLGLRFEF